MLSSGWEMRWSVGARARLVRGIGGVSGVDCVFCADSGGATGCRENSGGDGGGQSSMKREVRGLVSGVTIASMLVQCEGQLLEFVCVAEDMFPLLSLVWWNRREMGQSFAA
jgi:hypothetical protein